MRLVVSVLRNSGAARQLTQDLIQVGCQAERLLFLARETVQLDDGQSNSPGLHCAGVHQGTGVWCVREPEYFSTRTRDACSSLALCICLLERLQHSRDRVDWCHYRDNLDRDLPVSLLEIPLPECDELSFTRSVLAHAVERLQVLDLGVFNGSF